MPEISTRALRSMAIGQLYDAGYAIQRAPADQFTLQRQVYVISKGGASRTVALRTSNTGWIGFRREGEDYPVLDGIDSVLHVHLRPALGNFALKLTAVAYVRHLLDLRIRVLQAGKKHIGDIIWVSAELLSTDYVDDGFLPPAVYDVSADLVGNQPDDADPIQAALGLPDWMWQEIQDRANRAVVSPEVIIRVLLGDHFAAATQAPLPVSLGA
jgi:hypothetical protein